MELIKEIEEYINNYKDEIIENLCGLISIPSISCQDGSSYPYGKECAKALDYCMKLSEKKGLYIKNHEYYCVEAKLKEKEFGKKIVVASHADVVPANNDCIYPPFEANIIGDYIVGRGAVDDKGPLIATIYALAFFKEYNINLKNDIRLLFGSNEEFGMDDMDYYLKKCGQPDFAVAVDNDFPVCHGEKGVVKFSLKSKKSIELNYIISTGQKQRPIHDECSISIKDLKYIEKRKSPTDNVISTIIKKLWSENINILDNYTHNQALISILEDTTGRSMEIEYKDDKSGANAIKIYEVYMEDDMIVFNFDVRICISDDENRVIDKIKRFSKEIGFICDIKKVSPGYYISENHEIVVALTDLYNEVSKSNDKPYVMGASTYARKFKNACGFGAGNPREVKPFEKGHGSAHGADEAHNIDVLLNAIKMYILGFKSIDNII